MSRGKLLAQSVDGLHGLVDGQGRLRQPGDGPIGVDVQLVDRLGRLHHRDGIRCFARSALYLFVALVTDQKNLVPGLREPLGLVVDLRHQRTCGIDGQQVAGFGLVVHRRRDAVGAENEPGALGYLFSLIDEDRPSVLQFGDHMHVVHDLFTHVDRRPVQIERLLHRDDCSLDPGAVAAGCCQKDLSHTSMLRGILSARFRRLEALFGLTQQRVAVGGQFLPSFPQVQ